MYFLGNKMDYETLKIYSPADQDVKVCAFIHYWLKGLSNFDINDLKKFGVYLGFYSELTCDYPGSYKTFYEEFHGNPIPNFGYVFETKQPSYFPTIRPWFQNTLRKAGFTTFVSSYVFPSGVVGNTLTQPFYSRSQLHGVLGYDIMPFSAFDDEPSIIQTFLEPIIGNNSLEYFTVEHRLLKKEYK